MATALQVALFVASLTFIVLAICIIPVAFHLRRKVEQLVITVGQLKDKLEALAQDSHAMVRNVTELSKRANQQLDEVGHVVQTARQWTDRADKLVNEIGSAVEPPVHSLLRNMSLLRTGFATFFQFFSHRNQHNQTTKESDHV
jgi:outer membrane murein-binding lipoprotein Lpp